MNEQERQQFDEALRKIKELQATVAALQPLMDALSRIDSLQDFDESLKSNARIPQEVGDAFRERLRGFGETLAPSSKVQDSENDTINLALTSGTFNVLTEPDGWLETNIEGVTYYLPFYS